MDIKITNLAGTHPPGAVVKSWEETVLRIVAVAETQSCGGVEWTATYLLRGKFLVITATGRGTAMNCPMIPARFEFRIPGLERGDYQVTATFAISWQNR